MPLHEPVILWGDRLCSWIGGLDELGLQPSAVILLSSSSLDLVISAVGVDCFVGLLEDFVEVLLPSVRGKCRLGLVDGRVTKNLCGLAEKLDMSCLIRTVGLRCRIPGWEQDTLSLRHCEVGGITTALTQGICLTRGTTPSIREPVPDIVGREARTVLSATALSHKFRPSPEISVVTTLVCLNLGLAE
jgi:hypothetical protein